jgi:UDP-glucose 4-epimerase
MPEIKAEKKRSVLITGAGGYIGRQLTTELSRDLAGINTVVATDIAEVEPAKHIEGVIYKTLDVRSMELSALLKRYQIDCVVHLASIVTPTPEMSREFLHDVEVKGTRHVVESCIDAGVAQIIITSSGAAYGYWADNPEWLDEFDALRGNAAFAYSDHKRQVEEMLATFRREHPQLKQLILRPGTILGSTARNQITALFEKPAVLGIYGASSPFVLIWDRDVVGSIVKGIRENSVGIYNLAGDGTLSMREMAKMLSKPYLSVPAWLLKSALFLLKKVGLTQYGPEQVGFLRYRPVLSNRRLKDEFGYIPKKTTRQTFEHYLTSNK